ncbi:MAG TPA: T9SS type A sorting domain-containing protein [Flavitalea sp.]|nr:T9SS type A sorting domain-containing protein [Flavitalea sp.]
MTSFLQMPSPVVIANLILLLPTSVSHGAKTSIKATTSNKFVIDAARSIKINRSLVSKKYRIKLYPDMKQEAVFFSASGPKQKFYQLYLFDLTGKLISQASIAHKQTTLVEMKTKGTYLFEVFSDDEKIESGEVLVN